MKWYQFHENLTNETRRNACQKDCSSSSRKSSHQVAKKNCKKTSISFEMRCLNRFLILKLNRKQLISLDWFSKQSNRTKKKSRLNDNRNDEKMKFMINRSSSQQSWKQADFVSFDDDENENARYAKQARYARYNLAKHDIDQKFLFENFFDDMYDN